MGVIFCNGFYLDYNVFNARLGGLYDFSVTANLKKPLRTMMTDAGREAFKARPDVDLNCTLRNASPHAS
jgi:hypothetical protein